MSEVAKRKSFTPDVKVPLNSLADLAGRFDAATTVLELKKLNIWGMKVRIGVGGQWNSAELSADDVGHIGMPRYVTLSIFDLTKEAPVKCLSKSYPNATGSRIYRRSGLLGAFTCNLLSMEYRKTFARSLKLYRLLQANDFAAMQTLFAAFYSSIPNDWYRNNPIAQYEGYYASVFYSYFAAMGLDLTAEESSNAGRLDMALRFNGHIYLFEFKVVELAPEGRALEQIKAYGYAERYRGSGQPIHLIGVEFSKQTRSVVGFEVETLPQ